MNLKTRIEKIKIDIAEYGMFSHEEILGLSLEVVPKVLNGEELTESEWLLWEYFNCFRYNNVYRDKAKELRSIYGKNVIK